jgi:polyisoprenyl-phosphate glycosyltransferase
MHTNASKETQLVVIIPIFNEEQTIGNTLVELAASVAQLPCKSVEIVVVNDGSRDKSGDAAMKAWKEGAPSHGTPVQLHLVQYQMNQGHQRAILTGFRFAATAFGENAVYAVMDGDGQDDPQAIGAMLETIERSEIVFAQRTKRAEGLLWKLAYYSYQFIIKMLVGKPLFFGNFCMFRRNVLDFLILQADLSHLAALLSFSPFVKASVPVARRARSEGDSKMSFVKLVDYGVAALLSSSDTWVRMFTRMGILIFASSMVFIVAVLGTRFFSDLAIPGWASTMVLIGLSVSFQALGFLVVTSIVGRVLKQCSPVPIPRFEVSTHSGQGELGKNVRGRAS